MKLTYSSWIYLSAAIAAGGSVATLAHAKESLPIAPTVKTTLAKAPFASKATALIKRSPASSEDTEKMILGSWNLSQLTEQCNDLTAEAKGEVWHFESNKRFVRTFSDGRPPQVGQWKLKQGSEIAIRFVQADGGGSEEQFIQALDGKQLELLAPTQVQKGVVVKMQRVAAFFHS